MFIVQHIEVASNQILMLVYEPVSLDLRGRGLFFFLHTQLFFVVALNICLNLVIHLSCSNHFLIPFSNGITSSYDILKLYKIFNNIIISIQVHCLLYYLC